ncbi:MAG TPA: dockerin type I domain-containing protein, partial [Bacillota bacterium]|nr:dockerin type I domain-containing protein [Bacillota bacterium]
PEELAQILKETAKPLADANYPDTPNYGYGYGLVHALAAVQKARCGVITGRVLAPGVDEEAPEISHQQEVTFLYQGYGFPLEATVEDNVGVTSVKAQVRTAGTEQWEDVSMYLYAGDHRSGDYWGQVPWDSVTEPGLQYRFVAEDAAGNQSESPIYEVEVQFGVAPGWSEDFSDEPLFWEWDGDWQWGVPTVGPAPQYGGKLMATNLDGNYSNDAASVLWAPPFDLRGATAPLLRLDHWYQTEPNNDVCLVMISTDYGQTWLYALFTGDSGGWKTVQINLQPYIVSNPIYLCFVFQSNESINYPGWYIDRVSLVEMGMTGENLFDQSDGWEQIEIAADPIRGIEPEIPFRQPLQGPESLNQPLDDTANLLPVAAELIIEPTGLTAANNPADGSFSIRHPGSAGEMLTLRITAPGYQPAVRTFTLEELQTVDLGDIILGLTEGCGDGDVDQSGRVDVADAILVLRQIVGLVELTPSQEQSADVNLDGTVNVADAILILRFIVGLVPSLPVEN